MRKRLEKVDRDRVKDVLISLGCCYVRINHGTRFSNSRPDLEGIGLDGRFFGIEMKREDVDPEKGLTDKQRSDLKWIAASGGRACSAALTHRVNLDRGWSIEGFFPQTGESTVLDLPVFCKMILTGEGWPR